MTMRTLHTARKTPTRTKTTSTNTTKTSTKRFYLNKYTDMFVSLAFGTVKMVSFSIKYKYRSEPVRKRGRR